MFYATKIVSVGNGYVIDDRGNTLYFTGYLPVKEGDTVFSDGNVVFGNSKPKGSVVSVNEPSGIPVMSNFLRGYFKLDGSFKQFNIKGDNWLVNDKKIYAHDNEGGNENENIIDAEISYNGELFTAEKNVTQIEQNDEDFFYRYHNPSTYAGADDWVAFSIIGDGIPHDTYQITTYDFSMSAEDADFVKRDDSILKNCNLIIRKNSSTVTTLNFDDVIDSAEDIAANLIVPDSVSEFYILSSFYKKTRAKLVNFKILPSGEYTYLIRVATWAEYCFNIYDRFHYINASTPILVNFLFKISSTTTKGIEMIGQSLRRFPFWFDTLYADIDVPEGTIVGSEEAANLSKPYHIPKPNFPYTTFMATRQLGYLGEGIGSPVYYLTGLWAYKVWDSSMLPNANDYDGYTDKVKNINDNFTFPIQDGFSARLVNANENIDSWRLAAILDPNNQPVTGALLNSNNAHKWDMAIAPLKNNQYLFAAHNHGLYFINSDRSFTLIDSGVKNFRLRELKKIRKAKK